MTGILKFQKTSIVRLKLTMVYNLFKSNWFHLNGTLPRVQVIEQYYLIINSTLYNKDEHVNKHHIVNKILHHNPV